MQAFRSEGEIDRWCALQGRTRSAGFTPATLWRLASIWYDDRLDRNWRRHTVAERQALLTSVGLEGEAWRILP